MFNALSPPNPVADEGSAAYLQGFALAVFGAVFLSAKAIVAKLLYAQGIDAVTAIALRMLLALPAFALVVILTWNQQPRLTLPDMGRITVIGLLGYYAASMLDFLGLEYISAGLERMILFLAPSFVLLINRFWFKHQIGHKQWMCLLLAYVGIVLVFWHDVRLGDQVFLGGSLVLVATFCYALYLILAGEIIRRVGPLRLVSLAMVIASIASLLQYIVLRPWQGLFEQSQQIWTLSLVNSAVCTVLPIFMTMVALARIGASNTSLAAMVGPVSTLFLAWWILSEPLGAVQLSGTGLVMTGILLLGMNRPAASGGQPAV